VNTTAAAAAAMLGWLLVEKIRDGKGTSLGAASGLVAGLVAITPAAGFVGPMAAIAIGAAAGIACYGGVLLKARAGYDDALDAFGVHGVGGALGAILTGVFATTALTPDNSGGLLSGNAGALAIQLVGVAAAGAYAAAMTAVILVGLKATMGLRVTPDEEREGLDVALHGETGYTLGSTGATLAHDEPTPAPATGAALAREKALST
jgi:ammonium transporter, Amt family